MVANSPTSRGFTNKNNGGNDTKKPTEMTRMGWKQVKAPVFSRRITWQLGRTYNPYLTAWTRTELKLCEMDVSTHRVITEKKAPEKARPTPLFCGGWGPHLTGVDSNCWDNKFEAVDWRKS